MRKIPTQLRWPEFVALLKSQGFIELPSKRGSARHFQRLRDGEIFTFHEPHGGDSIRQGTLAEYLRKAEIDPEELWRVPEEASRQSDEEPYRRSVEADGTNVSNCTSCFAVVMKSKNEEDGLAAEAAHTCGAG